MKQISIVSHGTDAVFFLRLRRRKKMIVIHDGEQMSQQEQHSEPMDLFQLSRLSVELSREMCRKRFIPPYRIDGSVIVLEFPASMQEVGEWQAHIVCHVADTTLEDGMMQYSVSVPICSVVRSDELTGDQVQHIDVDLWSVAKGDPGDPRELLPQMRETIREEVSGQVPEFVSAEVASLAPEALRQMLPGLFGMDDQYRLTIDGQPFGQSLKGMDGVLYKSDDVDVVVDDVDVLQTWLSTSTAGILPYELSNISGGKEGWIEQGTGLIGPAVLALHEGVGHGLGQMYRLPLSTSSEVYVVDVEGNHNTTLVGVLCSRSGDPFLSHYSFDSSGQKRRQNVAITVPAGVEDVYLYVYSSRWYSRVFQVGVIKHIIPRPVIGSWAARPGNGGTPEPRPGDRYYIVDGIGGVKGLLATWNGHCWCDAYGRDVTNFYLSEGAGINDPHEAYARLSARVSTLESRIDVLESMFNDK